MVKIFNSAIRAIIHFLRPLFALFFSIINQVVGTIPILCHANRIISKRISDKKNEDFSPDDLRLKLPLKHLKEYYNSEIDRLVRIEDKAKSTILGITISITIIATPSVLLPTRINDLANESANIKGLLIIALILAVAFLLLSGYLAFLAFNVGEISKPLLEDHASLKPKDQIRKTFIKYIELNALRIIQRANFLSASFDCLRNGLVLFLLVLIMSLASML